MSSANNDRPYRPFKNQRARIEETRARIRRMHRDGLSRGEIAERVNLTPSSVTYHARFMGISFPKVTA